MAVRTGATSNPSRGEVNNNMAPKKPTRTDNRSAKTGRFVTERYAKTHPSTTVKETRKK